MIIRAGARGACCTRREWSDCRWVPAFHAGAGVVDVTGAGNSFLGGAVVGLERTGDVLAAARYGAVSASFTIEQWCVARVTSRAERAGACRRSRTDCGTAKIRAIGCGRWSTRVAVSNIQCTSTIDCIAASVPHLPAILAALSAMSASCAAINSSSVMPDLLNRLAFFCVRSCKRQTGRASRMTDFGCGLMRAGSGLDLGDVPIEAKRLCMNQADRPGVGSECRCGDGTSHMLDQLLEARTHLERGSDVFGHHRLLRVFVRELVGLRGEQDHEL